MSQLDLEAAAKEIDHLLSKPTATPNEFSTWIVNWLAANMDISTYQLRGLASTFFKAAPGQPSIVQTTSTTMVDLGGPILTGLSNGRYLAFWGANFGTANGVDVVGQMGISPNGAGASDTHTAKSRVTAPAEQVPCIYSRPYDLQGNDQNYLRAVYMKVAGGTPKWWNRWLVAVKVSQ